jgi:hypothetical protein
LRDGLLILKKPFDAVEVLQLASTLMEKWRLHQEARGRLEQLESLVRERTGVLAQVLPRYKVSPMTGFVTAKL